MLLHILLNLCKLSVLFFKRSVALVEILPVLPFQFSHFLLKILLGFPFGLCKFRILFETSFIVRYSLAFFNNKLLLACFFFCKKILLGRMFFKP